MATAAFDRFACETQVVRDAAKDAVEDRVADTATHIRKEPFKFVGLAFAVGVPVGLALGWIFSSFVKPLGPAQRHP